MFFYQVQILLNAITVERTLFLEILFRSKTNTSWTTIEISLFDSAFKMNREKCFFRKHAVPSGNTCEYKSIRYNSQSSSLENAILSQSPALAQNSCINKKCKRILIPIQINDSNHAVVHGSSENIDSKKITAHHTSMIDKKRNITSEREFSKNHWRTELTKPRITNGSYSTQYTVKWSMVRKPLLKFVSDNWLKKKFRHMNSPFRNWRIDHNYQRQWIHNSNKGKNMGNHKITLT